jgi:hypothetical protein
MRRSLGRKRGPLRHLVGFTLLLLGAPLQAQQDPAIGPHCAAAFCEAGTIYAVAIDTLWRAQPTPPTLPPRVYSAVYLVPFGPLPGEMRGAPLASFATIDGGMLARYWPQSSIVDSAGSVQTDGHTLKPGGTLFVVGPIDWMGPDSARLQLAEYPKDLSWGVQYFVWVERGPKGWRATRVAVGWQN